MQIISDFTKDIRIPKPQPGAYQWWYFDAIDVSDKFKFVIIFYEGNPFSPRYIKGSDAAGGARAADHPAISISVYRYSEPIYYSFTEFDTADGSFDETQPLVQIGNHSLKGYKKEGEIIYELKLDEVLPSGDAIRGKLRFRKEHHPEPLFKNEGRKDGGHFWNLVQPCATVQGQLQITGPGKKKPVDIPFKGLGYHDHNTGTEPMSQEFKDWYWGRFHFPKYTLVYYLMNRKNTQQHKAWLIDRNKHEVCRVFDEISLADKALSVFGLHSFRKISIENEDTQITVQQSQGLDSGPFYQRFYSEAFLLNKSDGEMETARGFSEYIYPDRIYSKVFWPLVNMRIWYKGTGAHWVQKSPKLYRWTW